MASPIGFGDCLAIIQEGIKIYNKIKDAKEQVKDMGERLQGIKKYISRIQSIITDNKQSALARLRPDLTNDINDILRRIKKDARQVAAILKAWHDCEGPFGFTWTSHSVSNFFNSVFSGKPDDLDKLNKRLEREETEMRDWFGMLQTVGIDALLKGDNKTLKPPPSPGRAPSPMRSNYNVMFIDSFNEGRSVIAQSYALLLREWTIRTQNRWPLANINSTGLLIRNRSALATQLESLRMTLRDGNTVPSRFAMNALFDAPTFNYPYKQLIRQGASARLSRGLPADLFTNYDYILLFNRIDAANLERLRELLSSQSQNSIQHLGATPKPPVQKAKLKLLGDYGNTGKSEIWNPRGSDDEKVLRQRWNAVVGNIKVSLKTFLKRECGWVQPAPGTAQMQS